MKVEFSGGKFQENNNKFPYCAAMLCNTIYLFSYNKSMAHGINRLAVVFHEKEKEFRFSN